MAVVTEARRTTYAEAAKQLLRDTLLDAARDQLRSKSWAEVTMAVVAQDAGVSRQTLYKEFGSREEFAEALVQREVTRFLGEVEAAVAAHRNDPTRALSAAFAVFLHGAAEDPVVRSAVSGDGTGDLLPLVTTQGGPVVERAAAVLHAVVTHHWPATDPQDARLLAEAVVRLAISFAALPMGSTDEAAQGVARLLGPFLDRALCGPAGS